mgnify:FL=1
MTLQIISIAIVSLCLVLLFILLFRKPKSQADINVEKIANELKVLEKIQNEKMDMLSNSFTQNMTQIQNTLVNTVSQNDMLQNQKLEDIRTQVQALVSNVELSMRNAITQLNEGLLRIQQENEKKLEQMRQTVDEKLNVSLENRLSQSFNIINERLQSVYEGIGVMKQLASGVGDLKKVLTNIKTRGTWGEIQLGTLLEQILTKEQYFEQININPKNGERVDFVIRMPGKDDGDEVYLPIDAKFPLEDYQRLVEASENGSKEDVDMAVKNLEKRVKEEAKRINEKYIFVPKTTDFAVMYLPIEGLYAEVLRIPGLCEMLQQNYKIVICGPTTLSALLNSLQLGFKTLSIQKRSSEVWNLLSVFKREFSKFVDLLAKTQKKLDEASNTIEFATKKSRTIEKKLKDVASIEGDTVTLSIDDVQDDLKEEIGDDE